MLQPQAPAAFSTPAVGAQPVLLLDDDERLLADGEGSSADALFYVHPTELWSSSFSSSSRGAAAGGGGDAEDDDDDDDGDTLLKVKGEVALVMPHLGASQCLLNADHHKVYYSGMPMAQLRRHGDELQHIGGGYYRVNGRVDDSMNLGGIKVSSLELERAVVEGVKGVAEAAAVAVKANGGGPDQLVLFVVLDRSSNDDGNAVVLKQACQKSISSQLNPLFHVGDIRVVASLPRTASNKVLRRVLRDRLVASFGVGGDDINGRSSSSSVVKSKL